MLAESRHCHDKRSHLFALAIDAIDKAMAPTRLVILGLLLALCACGSSERGSGSDSGGTVSNLGGTSGTAGNLASGGSFAGGAPVGACPGSCSTAPEGSCSSPQVRITPVDIGSALSYSTDETYALPLALAAMPGGGSRLIWMTGYSHYGSSNDSLAHVAELDCDDHMVGTPFTLPAHDFQDIAADADGIVIVLTRDGQGGPDDQHCGDVNNLCILPTDRPGCYDTYMVRYDCSGAEQWATKLTTTSANAPLYDAGSGQNYGVWWYQHHGRIAYDGSNYAAYFCDSITVTNNSCDNHVDIHEGDRMQVVDPTGTVLSGHDSFNLGCSHSWTTRMLWDPRVGHFVMVCATDNNCRIARPSPYRTLASAECDGTLFGGDVVNSSTDGYWTVWSYQETIRLIHFTYDGGPDATIDNVANGSHPHLVSYGSGQMLVAWESGSAMAAKVLDAGTGAEVSTEFPIALPDHPWQSFKAYPDASVAFASVDSASSTVQVARVLPCSD